MGLLLVRSMDRSSVGPLRTLERGFLSTGGRSRPVPTRLLIARVLTPVGSGRLPCQGLVSGVLDTSPPPGLSTRSSPTDGS